MKKICYFLALFGLLLSLATGNRTLANEAIAPSAEQLPSFAFVYSEPNRQFVQTLVNQISGSLPTQTVTAVNAAELSATLSRTKLSTTKLSTTKLATTKLATTKGSSSKQHTTLVTTGRSALAEVLASPYYRQHRIVCTLISSADYYAEINKYSPAELQTTALFSDPSPAHQIYLAALLIEKPRIAFIYDTQTQFLINTIRAAAKANELPEPTFIENTDTNINVILQNRQLADADILLASPLKAIYNSENTKNIIFTLLSRNQALIGYSSGWVSSGALATVYSDKDDITHSLADLLNQIANSFTVASSQTTTAPTLPAPQYPNHINVKLNQNIAKLLAIEPVAETTLVNSLRERIAKHAH